jgi:hypothetical protein
MQPAHCINGAGCIGCIFNLTFIFLKSHFGSLYIDQCSAKAIKLNVSIMNLSLLYSLILSKTNTLILIVINEDGIVVCYFIYKSHNVVS